MTISNCKLALSFDPAKLGQDLAEIESEAWVKHFNQSYFEGDWSGVALRSIGGSAARIYPDPNATGDTEDTEILSRCDHLRAAVTAFKCPIRSARLLKLAPGAHIREHRDYNLGPEDGEIRLHVPITTNREVEFYLDAEKIEMKEGECWYLNFNLPHWVKNSGQTDRVHLVLDCVLNDWLTQLLPDEVFTGEESTVSPESSPQEFERFRRLVLENVQIQERLRLTNDRESFARLAVRIGRELGYAFNHEDVATVIRAARRAWFDKMSREKSETAPGFNALVDLIST